MANGAFWVLRCVVHLRKLRPDMDIDEARRIARSALVRTTGSPEQAARFFAHDDRPEAQGLTRAMPR